MLLEKGATVGSARLFVLLATRAATLEELRGKPPEGADGDALSLF